MKIDFDISGWREDYSYEKFDTVFFTGEHKNSTTGCLPVESGYYYAEAAQAGAAGAYNSTVASQSPTGTSTKWTRSFPSTPSYGSSIRFEAYNDRVDFGDGYYKLMPKSQNSVATKYNLNFDSRTDKEAKAILHFLGHRFDTPYSGAQRTEDGVETLTGFNFTPFEPYNQTGIYHCENFVHEYKFPNVNNVTAEFIRDIDTPTNWKNRVINLDNTSGFWAADITYSKFDIVYYSGHNVSSLSGYFYYSGDSPTTSSSTNKPNEASTVWTNRNFFFKPTQISESQKPRILKTDFANQYTQRASDGLNTNLLKLDLAFDGRDNKEAKALTHFLINKQGYESFGFVPPKPYQQEYKFFVCQKWSENVLFDENKSISASFEEYPLNLTPPKTIFRTCLFDTGSPDFGDGAQLIANGADSEPANEVYLADFGTFMTGFGSGTGFYLVNSGTQRITSDLYISGDNNTTGLYYFKDQGETNKAFTIVDGPASHARYVLDPLESGFFEIKFALTGKSSLIGESASLGLYEGITFYERGHGGAGYPGPFNKNSQLYITTVDRFGTQDTSGTLKVDLTGNASPVAPGQLTDFRAHVSSGIACPVITGSFEFTEPFTATGVLIEVSGIPNTESHATSPATGVMQDYNSFSGMFGYHRNYYLDPLKNYNVHLTHDQNVTEDGYAIQESNEIMGGVFDFHCKPGKTYYFRARSQNIDIIGGNLNGGTSRTVLSSDYVHTSVSMPQMDLTVPVVEGWANKVYSEYGEGVKSIGPSKSFGGSFLENVNLRGFISGTLSGAKNIVNLDGRVGDNADIDIDDFVGIKCNIGENVLIFSADHTVPALITGPKVTFAGGSTVPLTIHIPSSSSILGAGGKGGDSFQPRSSADSKGYPAASFITVQGGASAMDRSRCKVGSIIELQGVGPISLYATSGLMDGKYILPKGGGSYASNVSPQNAQDGGTALHIDSTYNGQVLTIDNHGFIGGGGGGGGAGGARMSNMTALKIHQNRPDSTHDNEAYYVNGGDKSILRDMNKDGSKIYSMLNSFTIGNSSVPGFRQGGDVVANGHMLQHKGIKNIDGTPKDGHHTNIREIRPGGGGGAGCGFDYQTNVTLRANFDRVGITTNPVNNDAALRTTFDGGMVGISTATIQMGGTVGVGTDTITYKTTKSSSISQAKGGKGTSARSLPKSAKQSSTSTTLYRILNPSQAGKACSINATAPWTSVAGIGGAGAIGVVDMVPNSAQRGTIFVGDPSGMNVHHSELSESFYNGGGFGGEGGYWGEDGINGEHPVQNYIDRYISARYGPEPRNFSYAGTGGLCIETNGAKVKFTPTGGFLPTKYGRLYEEKVSMLPCSGQDDKSKEDPKNSELYRNVYGIGAYLTCKHTSFTTKAASGTMPVGLISGLQGRRLKASDTANYGIKLSDKGGAHVVDAFASDLVRSDVHDTTLEGDSSDNIERIKNISGPSFEGVNRKEGMRETTTGTSNAVNSSYPTWKAFNQEINGDFDNYVFFDRGVGGVAGFPYYLIYDLGEGNEATVASFSLTSAGASLSYYENGDNHLNLFGECYAPTEFELRATNLSPSLQGEAESVGDTTVATHMLDKNTTLIWAHDSNKDKKIEIKDYPRLDGNTNVGNFAGKFGGKDQVWQGRNIKPYPASPFRYPRLGIISESTAKSNKSSVVLYDHNGDGDISAQTFGDSVANFQGNSFNHYVSVPGATRRYTISPVYKATNVVDNKNAEGEAGSIKFNLEQDTSSRKKFRYYILKIFSADNFPMSVVEYNGGAGGFKILEKAVYLSATKNGKCKIADFGLRGSNRNFAGFISDRS